jgi:hypothetical protein
MWERQDPGRPGHAAVGDVRLRLVGQAAMDADLRGCLIACFTVGEDGEGERLGIHLEPLGEILDHILGEKMLCNLSPVEIESFRAQEVSRSTQQVDRRLRGRESLRSG